MRAARHHCALIGLFALCALVAGCGGGSSSSSSSSGGGSGDSETAQSRPAPAPGDFPSAKGKTLGEVIETASGPSELVISPAATVFYKGENRYPFGVFERDRTQVPDAEVALYFSKVPEPKKTQSKTGNKGQQAKAEERALEAPAVGPFTASVESLATKPQYRAKTTVEDPDAASVVYSTEVPFPRNGEWRMAALVKDGSELKGTLMPSAVVGEFKGIPQAGEPAPKIHTPTASEVHGDLAKITTRIPPDHQNKVDYAEVLGKAPILLLFATPQFCQSRVCGPVVDVAEQLQAETGEKANFIHMEIYKDNDPSKGVRSQVRAFRLPSEPWLFAIDSHGDISSVTEGAFGLEHMEEVIDKVVSE